MTLPRLLFCLIAAASLGGCYSYGNDEGLRYLQRKDTVTLSAGDAKEVNARTHMIHPWPPGVGDPRIPMEGTKAARAVECYRQGAGRQVVSDQNGRAPIQYNTAVGGGAGSGGSGGSASAGGTQTQLKC